MRKAQEYDWFYKKPAWRKIREMALSRDDHMCQHCLRGKEITSADVVHHIVYVEQDFSLALTLENLICLCHYHHNLIHKDDHKRNRKKEAQAKRNIKIIQI